MDAVPAVCQALGGQGHCPSNLRAMGVHLSVVTSGLPPSPGSVCPRVPSPRLFLETGPLVPFPSPCPGARKTLVLATALVRPLQLEHRGGDEKRNRPGARGWVLGIPSLWLGLQLPCQFLQAEALRLGWTSSFQPPGLGRNSLSSTLVRCLPVPCLRQGGLQGSSSRQKGGRDCQSVSCCPGTDSEPG